MILNEQKYRKKTALYYHGSDKNLDELEPQEVSGTTHRVMYVTKSPYYAYKNYLKNDGFLYECKFTKPLDIFNANCKIDLFRLKKGMYLSSGEVLALQFQDWLVFDVIKGINISNKGNLIDRVFSLGYDGFYNNENASGEYNFDGIGLFSGNSIEIIKKYTKEEAEKYIKEIRKNIESKEKKSLVDRFLGDQGLTKDIMREIFKNDRKKLERLNESEWKSLLPSINTKTG